MDINIIINELLEYGLHNKFIKNEDYIYISNKLIDLFQFPYFKYIETKTRDIDFILNDSIDYVISKKILNETSIIAIDNFKARIMDLIMPRPSEVIASFWEYFKNSPQTATGYLYKLSIDANYVQTKRIAQNYTWTSLTRYGNIELSINLSKPEKDSKSIVKQMYENNGYPKCQLCIENEGFFGNISYESKANMRIIPIKLNNENWSFQYSPYAYFREHSIILNNEHIPMEINKTTFIKLIDFLDLFPHYLVGSNSGLPIVGGSILNHEHFQAGMYMFPIESAKEINVGKYKTTTISRLVWPINTIRLSSINKNELIEIASKIHSRWKDYNNNDLLIINSKDEIHNSITPIARKRGNKYIIDIVLRNNYTNDEFPNGVFHPYPKYHNLKKENIGLIEAMGLGVLPPRLKQELSVIEEILKGNLDLLNNETILKHKPWVLELINKYKTEYDIEEFIKNEIAEMFIKILECTAVFKEKSVQYFEDFIKSCLSN